MSLLVLQAMLLFGWRGAVIAAGAVWRCGGTPGAQCVMIDGIWMKHMWCVHSWAAGTLCLSAGRVSHMARAQALYTWMSSTALEKRGAYGNVRRLRMDMTADIRRMQVWFAQVSDAMCLLSVLGKVTNYVTLLLFMESNALYYFCVTFALLFKYEQGLIVCF